MPLGTIKKLVRTASVLVPQRSGADGPDGEGYGIISGATGEQVFFVDSAVRDGRFDDLERGQRVRYTLEEGPLMRAAIVQPTDTNHQPGAAPRTPPAGLEAEPDRP